LKSRKGVQQVDEANWWGFPFVKTGTLAIFFVVNIEGLGYIQKHATKCEKVDKIQDRLVARLKRFVTCELI
jgi:hypothetical protein